MAHRTPPARDVVRAFIALELAPEIKQAIAEYLQPLKKLADGVSWVRSENLHLTLKFLGDTPQAQIPELAASLGKVCARHEVMHAKFFGSGAFPNEKHPRVLWLGLQTESGSLSRLAADIDAACVHLGFQAESHPLTPHLTIGRVRSGRVEAVLRAIHEKQFSSPEVVFRECSFMRSDLHAAGALYTPLHKFPFTGGYF